jgi:hypothetical protein
LDVKPISDRELEKLAFDGLKHMKAFFAYKGHNPKYFQRAKLGSVAVENYMLARQREVARLRRSEAPKKKEGESGLTVAVDVTKSTWPPEESKSGTGNRPATFWLVCRDHYGAAVVPTSNEYKHSSLASANAQAERLQRETGDRFHVRESR